MQHVKPKWLSIYAYSTLLVDIGLVLGYFYLQNTNANQATLDHWGITPLVLVLAGIHATVTLFVYPFLRKLSEWAGFVGAMIPYGLLLSAIIETSGNTNLVYRLLFIVLVFMLNMVGPYLAIASAVVAWILLIFDFLQLSSSIPEARPINVIADILVSFAAVGGWFFFRRYYIKKRDQETIVLANLLEQEQIKSSVVLESIADGVIVLNTKGAIQIINKAAANMFGWDKDEVLHMDYKMLYKLADEQAGLANPRQVEDVVAQTLQTNKPHQTVVLVNNNSRKQFYVDIVASPITSDVSKAGEPIAPTLVGVIVVFRDVDKQKKEEQQRTEFISTASHEMRTPVAAIEGYLALAMNNKVSLIDEKARSYLEKAHASTQHLGQLFQDLLTSAKADDGRLASHPEVVEFEAFLEKLIEDLRFAAEKKGLALEYVMGTDDQHIQADSAGSKIIKPLYYVVVDPDRIREVITNLFDNAVKYTPSGKITIGLTGNEQVVQFYIQDTGSGIPPEDVPHLFQKFYRVDNSATRTIGGTGLGLFICRKIVELYGGRIWVKSQQGKGSTFYVNLPRLDRDKVDAERQRLASLTTPSHPQQPTSVVQ